MMHLRGVYGQADEVVTELMHRNPRKALARDDIADALVLAVTAWLSASAGKLKEVPREGDWDRNGRGRTISYYCFS
ncbi:putative RNase H-like nuclease [Paenibacillus sp. PvR052]|nr:putative RNase H-like nuclease [Paenibacillus sp. PvP091]MBP1168119.1 putative RNase H-like nuclease [Paenibacillus sp. PvR098]MBP2439147.1 putative RNase H-like nuclease [Paenibacillus sp. PvP052]